MSGPQSLPNISPALLLRGYASGVFPMAENADSDEIFWVDPKLRGIIPLDKFHVSRSMRRYLQRSAPKVTVNSCFDRIVERCAEREETWINEEISELYSTLQKLGYAHSVEVWDKADLVGGVYGVSLGRAFFGESMFSNAANGSKTALVYLVARLNAGGYTLFDVQFLTDHLASLGAEEVPRARYRKALENALCAEADFFALSDAAPLDQVLHLSTQTS